MTDIPQHLAVDLALALHFERFALMQQSKRMAYDDMRRWENSLRLHQIDQELKVVEDRARVRP